MACLIELNRDTSSISSAHVRAVIGPTPGTVLRLFNLSRNSGSRSRELTKAYSVFCSRTIVSRLSFNNGRMLSSTSPLLSNQQLTEVLHLVQTLFVMAHARFH